MYKILFFALFLFALPLSAQEQSPMISAIGHAERRIAPNLAYITVYTTAYDKEYRSASLKVGKSIEKFRGAIAKMEPNHIEVGSEHLQPNGNGYSVTRTMVVRLVDLKKAHEVSTYLADRSARFSVTYSRSDLEQIKRQVRKEAMKDARNQAFALAQIAGSSLGEPLTIQPANATVMMPNSSIYSPDAPAESAFQTGQVVVTQYVNATFALTRENARKK